MRCHSDTRHMGTVSAGKKIANSVAIVPRRAAIFGLIRIKKYSIFQTAQLIVYEEIGSLVTHVEIM